MRAIVSGKSEHVMFRCPGCDDIHVVDRRWTFNNDLDRPTITPSICVWKHEAPMFTPIVACHCWVTDGMIRFLSDSTHALRNKTVALPELDKVR